MIGLIWNRAARLRLAPRIDRENQTQHRCRRARNNPAAHETSHFMV
jgi:hypothetical protein